MVVKELNPIQEVAIVKQIKQKTEELLRYMNIMTLETQKESLELINQQLAKVYQAIQNNIDNEEIRLQLRDIENNLKYNYIGLSEMVETEEIKKTKQQENKIKVTHNEYENIAKELASRIYANDETKITYAEYEKMLDNYYILPFEINIDNEEIKKIINVYADNEEIESDRTLYRGSIDKSILYNLYQNKGYNILYNEYYQVIIYKDELKAILTYCEGDFIAEVYNSIESYNKGIASTKQFIEAM